MSFLDRIAAAIAPAASDKDRAEARRQIEELSVGQTFAEDIVRQHKVIEQLFVEARSAAGAEAQSIITELAILLNGHSQAEEAVVYPEISAHSGKVHAGMAYTNLH
jgi:hemerythrin superfamily protein